MAKEQDGDRVEIMCDCGNTVTATAKGYSGQLLEWHCPHCNLDKVEGNE